MDRAIIPSRLCHGDNVGIITPASPVRPEFIRGAAESLRHRGLIPRIMPHAFGPAFGSYAATAQHRISDFLDAWRDPDIKAIICARGGYGSVDILDHVMRHNLLPEIKTSPKWLIGFSDISALHAMLSHVGIASLHAPMAKDISRSPDTSPLPDISVLFDILCHDKAPCYTITAHPFNRPGEACGILTGGNLATINALASTPFDPLKTEEANRKILFIEDIGENIYEINRMLIRLHMSGFLDRVAGIIVGQFTEYRPDRTYADMEEMIHAKLCEWEIDCPVLFDFPAGHTDINMPLPLGAMTQLTVNTDKGTLHFTDFRGA